METCVEICTTGQEFLETGAPIVTVLKDFSELPYTFDVSSLIMLQASMPLAYVKLFSHPFSELNSDLATILTPNADMTVTIGTAGLVEIEAVQVEVAYWSCANPPAVADKYSRDNLDLRKISVNSMNLTLYDCST